jgi:hypothetical protein
MRIAALALLGQGCGTRRVWAQGKGSDERAARGLREALQIGAANTVKLTGKLDGYFRNPAIKIPMPRQLRTLESAAKTLGAGKQVDQFVLSMNRAAESATPKAEAIVMDAIRGLTFRDALQILRGGDTAATDLFREKTTPQLTTAFQPIVRKSMSEAGVAEKFEQLQGKLKAIPLAGGAAAFDLDEYVVSGALKGLFHTLGQEERKIRRDPAARVTDLLKDVFRL